MRRKWTDDEIKFIQENYLNMNDYELSLHMLNRSEASVACRRKKLGLLREKLKHSFNDVISEFSKTDYILLSTEEDFKDTATNSLKYIYKVLLAIPLIIIDMLENILDAIQLWYIFIKLAYFWDKIEEQ